MSYLYTDPQKEKAILVGIITDGTTEAEVLENLDELERLADTAGALVTSRITQNRAAPEPSTYIGRGKLEELAAQKEYDQADLVIFDEELSPRQVKNLETFLKCKVMDRTGLILDIFASNARTSESKTQVEMAQLEYMLPRLTRMWTHLSKQKGGIGTKGPGETQIETDRRLIRIRITTLKEKLAKIQTQKLTQRKSRNELDQVTVVGYTNAGKSTLMNMLTNAEVLVEDRLFATLDSTTRLTFLDSNKKILLTDTVGFIRKLPHHLVASFRSTLDEVRNADVLVHLVDLSHPNFREHIAAVHETLKDLEIDSKPVLLVFNKVDQVHDPELLHQIRMEYPGSVLVSAYRGINIPELKSELLHVLENGYTELTAELPLDASKALAFIHSISQVKEIHYTEQVVRIRFRLNKRHEAGVRSMLDSYQRAILIQSFQ
ncbi:MAG: GTPase HflX [Bacteroidetes bacterium]|nr:GTPase HflX [Bacteroidota bacterium]